MIDLQDRSCRPTLAQMGEAVGNPVFMQFCTEIKDTYQCNEKIEYSSCSWQRGWNAKFRKAGRTLCTIYPREGSFAVMVVVGAREKALVEAILPDCTAELADQYHQTQEGNGQKWLMIDIEDPQGLYADVLRLIEIRRAC